MIDLFTKFKCLVTYPQTTKYVLNQTYLREPIDNLSKQDCFRYFSFNKTVNSRLFSLHGFDFDSIFSNPMYEIVSTFPIKETKYINTKVLLTLTPLNSPYVHPTPFILQRFSKNKKGKRIIWLERNNLLVKKTFTYLLFFYQETTLTE